LSCLDVTAVRQPERVSLLSDVTDSTIPSVPPVASFYREEHEGHEEKQ